MNKFGCIQPVRGAIHPQAIPFATPNCLPNNNISPMTSAKPAITPDRKTLIFNVGREQTPVAIVEDFLLSLKPLKEAARRSQKFAKSEAFYPGKIAPLLPQHLQILGNTIVPFMHKMFGVPTHFLPQLGTTYFGLASTPPGTWTPSSASPISTPTMSSILWHCFT